LIGKPGIALAEPVWSNGPVSFDVAATAYDEYMGAWSSQLARPLVDLARVRGGHTALDVGCGPGAVVAVLVDRLSAEAVSAVDPSSLFVAAVTERHPGIDVRLGAAEQLPFADATFDAALASLVVHFMADPRSGLSEMARVTRAGGTVVASVWDFGGGRGPLGPFWETARELDPDVVDESPLPGARQGHLPELFAAAGLREIDETSIEAQRSYESFDAWWEPFTRGVGPAGTYVAGLDGDRRERLRDACRPRLPADSFVLTATAWAARGTATGHGR